MQLRIQHINSFLSYQLEFGNFILLLRFVSVKRMIVPPSLSPSHLPYLHITPPHLHNSVVHPFSLLQGSSENLLSDCVQYWVYVSDATDVRTHDAYASQLVGNVSWWDTCYYFVLGDDNIDDCKIRLWETMSICTPNLSQLKYYWWSPDLTHAKC